MQYVHNTVSPLVFNTAFKVLANVIRKMYTDNDIGIEGNKLSVFVDINFRPRKSKS